MSSCDQIFCRNIYYLRKLHHLTQKEMAAVLGVSTGTLRRIEAGHPSVRLHCAMLDRVCDRFQLPADRLLREDMLAAELRNASPKGWHCG